MVYNSNSQISYAGWLVYYYHYSVFFNKMNIIREKVDYKKEEYNVLSNAKVWRINREKENNESVQ